MIRAYSCDVCKIEELPWNEPEAREHCLKHCKEYKTASEASEITEKLFAIVHRYNKTGMNFKPPIEDVGIGLSQKFTIKVFYSHQVGVA